MLITPEYSDVLGTIIHIESKQRIVVRQFSNPEYISLEISLIKLDTLNYVHFSGKTIAVIEYTFKNKALKKFPRSILVFLFTHLKMGFKVKLHLESIRYRSST